MSSRPAIRDLERVGEGRTAEIFAWGEGRVLRLFRADASREYALREMRISRSVHEAGLPSPAVYPADSGDGLIEIDGRLGFVMERIDGRSMLHLLIARPWRLWRVARRFAGLHRTIHSTAADGLPDQREKFHRVLDRISEQLGAETTDRIRRALERQPHDSVVCHGDFHPDNILMSQRGPVVIDWGPASSGHPAADIAWTAYLFRHGGVPLGMGWLQRSVVLLLRCLFFSVYRRAYLRGSTLRWGEVARWGPVIAAIRLGDGIPEERELLLRFLRREFGGNAGAAHDRPTPPPAASS